MQVRRRPVQPEDMQFLFEVYASTRLEELSAVPLTPEQLGAFLNMQFTAQHLDYTRNHPGAGFDVVMLGDEAIGRMYVAQTEAELCLLDIALLPQWRGRGIGTQLILELQEQAAEAGLPIRLYVEAENQARRLYERLGFELVEDAWPYQKMAWVVREPVQANTAS